MNYCYKIELVDNTNCSAKVKYYVKDHEDTVFQETNVDLPISSTGTIVCNNDLHLYLSNMVPKFSLNKKYALVYDQTGINAVSTLTNIEFNVETFTSSNDIQSVINDLLNTTSTTTTTTT